MLLPANDALPFSENGQLDRVNSQFEERTTNGKGNKDVPKLRRRNVHLFEFATRDNETNPIGNNMMIHIVRHANSASQIQDRLLRNKDVTESHIMTSCMVFRVTSIKVEGIRVSTRVAVIRRFKLSASSSRVFVKVASNARFRLFTIRFRATVSSAYPRVSFLPNVTRIGFPHFHAIFAR